MNGPMRPSQWKQPPEKRVNWATLLKDHWQGLRTTIADLHIDVTRHPLAPSGEPVVGPIGLLKHRVRTMLLLPYIVLRVSPSMLPFSNLKGETSKAVTLHPGRKLCREPIMEGRCECSRAQCTQKSFVNVRAIAA